MHIPSPWLVLPVVLVVACTASEEDTDRVLPDEQAAGCIRVEPAEGGAALVLPVADMVQDPSVSVRGELTIANDCEGTLLVQRARTPGRDVLSLTGFTGGPIPPGAEETLTVTYTPEGPEARSIVVRVDSNDPDQRVAEVQVEVQSLAPRIEAAAELFDLGAPNIGCDTTGVLELRNTGNVDLDVQSVELAGPDAAAFGLGVELPDALAPYDETTEGPVLEASLTYEALDQIGRDATLRVTSSDPRMGVLDVPVIASGTRVELVRDFVDPVPSDKVDVLMVVDRDTDQLTDGDFASAMTASILDLRRALIARDVDFRLSAVVADGGCVLGDTLFFDNSIDETDTRAAFGIMLDLGLQLEPLGTDTERGLTIARDALSSTALGAGGCNEGLLREDASLALLFVSDEPDQSEDPWGDYLAAFRAAKDPDGADKVTVHTVGGPTPDGCDTSGPATGYHDATLATGGQFTSICDVDWPSTMAQLGRTTPVLGATYSLSQPPVVETIEIRVDGLLVTDWTYDPIELAITFGEASAPEAGQAVEIRYDRRASCD